MRTEWKVWQRFCKETTLVAPTTMNENIVETLRRGVSNS